VQRDKGASTGAAAVTLLGTMFLASGAAAVAGGAQSAATTATAADLQAERNSIDAWRAGRVGRLTSDTGWLTLTGLFWLKQGENSFGRASSNALILDNASLADTAGSFVLAGHQVRFVAAPGAGVTHDGRAVRSEEHTSELQSQSNLV